MVMKQKLLLGKLFIICLLLIVGTTAVHAEFSVNIAAENNTILPFESASYKVNITNTGSEIEVINIQADASHWILTPQATSITVGETKEFILTITPKTNVGISNYRIPLTFTSTISDQIAQESVFLAISLDMYTKGYPVNIRMTVDMGAEIDPRSPVEVDIFIKNNNLRNIDELLIKVESDLFSDSVTAPIEPLSSYRKKFLFNLDPKQAAGTYAMKVIATNPIDNSVVAEDNIDFEIIAYSKVIPNRGIVEKKILTSTELITLHNDGNKETQQAFNYNLNLWEDLWLKATPKGEVIRKDGQRMISWTLNFQAQETKEITLKRNFIPLAGIILAFILLIISYFIFRSPIISFKEVQLTAKDQEGTSEMKVRIFVKNRTNKIVDTIKVIERLPHIAEFVPHTHLGTLQPTKVTKSEKRGTLIRWEIDQLEPYEERIISFKIHSKLKIVGGVNLPETKIKYHSHGRERVTTSGATRISGK